MQEARRDQPHPKRVRWSRCLEQHTTCPRGADRRWEARRKLDAAPSVVCFLTGVYIAARRSIGIRLQRCRSGI